MLLGPFEVFVHELPDLLTGVRSIVITYLVERLVDDRDVAEHRSEAAVCPGPDEYGLCTEFLCSRGVRILDLGVIVVNLVDYEVATAYELVAVVVPVTGGTVARVDCRPVCRPFLSAACSGKGVKSHTLKQPGVLSVRVSGHEILDLRVAGVECISDRCLRREVTLVICNERMLFKELLVRHTT